MNMFDLHTKALLELSDDIKDSAVQCLRTTLLDETIDEIRSAFGEDKETWWASSHFYWGMSIRNLLRDNVCLDDKLPSGNWDDYYVPLVELACGVR